MTITIDISPDLESRLHEKATGSGLAVPDYVQRIVEKDAAVGPGPTKRGAAVLAALNSFLEQDGQEHRDTLTALQDALDKDRPGQRRIFGVGNNPLPGNDE